MNFRDKRYTDLIERFDDWYNMHNVVTTFKHLGLETDLAPDEYAEEVNKLQLARHLYPNLPLHEAYSTYSENPVPVTQSRGLGDTIYKITHATGLAKLAQAYTSITGKDCGCASRQEALNKLVPYGVKENAL